MVSEEEMHRKAIKGEISEDQYLRWVEKHCKHKPEIETSSDGRWVEWCENCGKKLDSGTNPNLVGAGSGSAKTVKVKGGCAVVAVMMLGAAGGLGWLVVELVL